MKNQFIHPEEPQDLDYWASKWGITVNQLRNAIIDTGCVNALLLHSYLRQKGVFSFHGLIARLKRRYLRKSY
jgi:hypothetical protein